VVHTAAIALEYLVIVSQQGQELLHDLRRLAARRDAVVHPLLFAKTIEQTRARKDLEMPRHARLALPEDLAKLAHRELRTRQQRQQTQPGRLACGTKR